MPESSNGKLYNLNVPLTPTPSSSKDKTAFLLELFDISLKTILFLFNIIKNPHNIYLLYNCEDYDKNRKMSDFVIKYLFLAFHFCFNKLNQIFHSKAGFCHNFFPISAVHILFNTKENTFFSQNFEPLGVVACFNTNNK